MLKRFIYIFVFVFLAFVSSCGNKEDVKSDSTNVVERIEEVELDASNCLEDCVAGTVFFGFDSSVINQRTKETLAIQAEFIKANNVTKVVLEGHCDERGTKAYNIALGERRASAVKDFFVLLGVNPAYIKVVSYGKERPIAMGQDEESFAQNRRVVTVVSSEGNISS